MSTSSDTAAVLTTPESRPSATVTGGTLLAFTPEVSAQHRDGLLASVAALGPQRGLQRGPRDQDKVLIRQVVV